jgi:hypothetical protein
LEIASVNPVASACNHSSRSVHCILMINEQNQLPCYPPSAAPCFQSTLFVKAILMARLNKTLPVEFPKSVKPSSVHSDSGLFCLLVQEATLYKESSLPQSFHSRCIETVGAA